VGDGDCGAGDGGEALGVYGDGGGWPPSSSSSSSRGACIVCCAGAGPFFTGRGTDGDGDQAFIAF
jgi:hypothetical protein